MRIPFAALLITFACALSADFHDFGPTQSRTRLFSLREDAKPDARSTGPAEEPPEDAHSHRDPAYSHAGRVGLAFWATPFLRFTEDPTGVGVGFGFEFSHMVSDRFGSMMSMSIWNTNVRVFDKDGDATRADVTCFDIELGSRFHALNWRSGRMYMDLRFVISFADGPAPVRNTVDLGGDMRWGFEFGDDSVRTFLEAGMGWRSAINYGDAGWLETGVSNGAGGMVFDLLRVGMRLYF